MLLDLLRHVCFITDYCSTLEGDEGLTLNSKTLRKRSQRWKLKKDNKTKNRLEVTEQSDSAQEMKLHIHVPDGLPKSQEEVMEEEKS
ncbi:hypothetical protein DY000_02005289 [Brassica cretica]|uniref:Uncharacterized protein n=1 Tax=Brassica cretica TaxID=69181 RepID=A0ABQ7BU86_BRACR|nr:hypothetical protein DY000_02005289 [Brassica cretica]